MDCRGMEDQTSVVSQARIDNVGRASCRPSVDTSVDAAGTSACATCLRHGEWPVIVKESARDDTSTSSNGEEVGAAGRTAGMGLVWISDGLDQRQSGMFKPHGAASAAPGASGAGQNWSAGLTTFACRMGHVPGVARRLRAGRGSPKMRAVNGLVTAALAIVPLALLVDQLSASHRPAGEAPPAAGSPAGLVIDYPAEGSIFPPDILPPTFLWHDPGENVSHWQIEVTFGDGSRRMRVRSEGERMSIGPIDERCLNAGGIRPELTTEQASTHTWKPDEEVWRRSRSTR